MTVPLNSLNIVEFAGIGPGPFAGMVLARLGAKVTLIDRPVSETAPQPGPLDAPVDVLKAGKTLLRLDLKSKDGHGRARELLAAADVLIEGFRPGVMEKLGLGPEPCLRMNPRLVYGRMTGWGQSGPLASTAGHDINYIALSGFLGITGVLNQPPIPPLNIVGDFSGGSLMLVIGILAALQDRISSGRGRVVDAAIVDGVSLLMSFHSAIRHFGLESGAPGTNVIDGGCPFYRTYSCRDGRFIAVGCLEPQFFQVFADTLRLNSAWREERLDKARWPQLRDEIAAIFQTRTRDEWASIFEGTDACVTPVLRLEEAPRHPHMRARESHTIVDGIRLPVSAPRFSPRQHTFDTPVDSKKRCS